VIGANRLFEHGGREYHIQAEDLGTEQACFEVRVYEKGSVLWRRRVAYAEVLERGLPKAELAEALRLLLEKTLTTVQAAIAKGKLGSS
jgi:hypothetical protein